MCQYSKHTDEKGKFDELIEDKGVKILIDPKALMHVIGTKMDFVDDKLRYEHVSVMVVCTVFNSRILSLSDVLFDVTRPHGKYYKCS